MNVWKQQMLIGLLDLFNLPFSKGDPHNGGTKLRFTDSNTSFLNLGIYNIYSLKQMKLKTRLNKRKALLRGEIVIFSATLTLITSKKFLFV
jgi:hypothetical protein